MPPITYLNQSQVCKHIIYTKSHTNLFSSPQSYMIFLLSVSFFNPIKEVIHVIGKKVLPHILKLQHNKK